MNKKTIKNVIHSKLVEWTNTITDKELSEKVLENSIVTGGCIASLLTNEKVNDFDIYIADKKVLYDLMEYYTKKLPIDILDGEFKDDYLSDLDIKIQDLENGEELNSYTIAINNLDEDQLKFYLRSKSGYKVKEKNSEDQNEKKYEVSYISPNAISLTDDLQIVVRFHGIASEIHKNYDFVHATNYYTEAEGLVVNVDAMLSLQTKTLYYTGSRYPVTSIIRMKKFIKRGFNINAGEIFKMIYQASLLNLTDPMVLEEQLIGVDIAYFDSFINELRLYKEENEDGELDSTVIMNMIDKIFNE